MRPNMSLHTHYAYETRCLLKVGHCSTRADRVYFSSSPIRANALSILTPSWLDHPDNIGVSRSSVVVVSTRLLAGRFFSKKSPDRLWGPPSLLFDGTGVLSRGIKRPDREVNPGVSNFPPPQSYYSWFAGRTFKSHNKWYTQRPKLLCNLYNVCVIYKCGRWQHNNLAGRGMDTPQLTTHLRLVQMLRMSGAIPLLPQYAFMARTGKTFPVS
jgi:hypothetical protein